MPRAVAGWQQGDQAAILGNAPLAGKIKLPRACQVTVLVLEEAETGMALGEKLGLVKIERGQE